MPHRLSPKITENHRKTVTAARYVALLADAKKPSLALVTQGLHVAELELVDYIVGAPEEMNPATRKRPDRDRSDLEMPTITEAA